MTGAMYNGHQLHPLLFSIIFAPLVSCTADATDEPDSVRETDQLLTGSSVFDADDVGEGPLDATGSVTNSLPNNMAQNCSGTLVTPDKVLTAAHCVTCVSGSQATFRFSGGTVSCSPYRNYSDDNFSNPLGAFDIAVIDLNTPMDSRTTVRPLMAHPVSALDNTFRPTTVVGYANDCTPLEACFYLRTRYAADSDDVYLRSDYCGGIFEGECSDTPLWFIPDSDELRLEKGDSGGPLFAVHRGETKVIGVASVHSKELIGHTGAYLAPPAASFDQAEWLAGALELPVEVEFDKIGIHGETTVKINDRAEVKGVNSTALQPTITGSFVEVGADARTKDVRAESGVWVRNRGHVQGLAKSYTGCGFQSGGRADDVEEDYSVLPSLEDFDEFLQGLEFTVEDYHTGSPIFAPGNELYDAYLSPGQFGRINVSRNARLNVSSGSYRFKELYLGPGSILNIDASDGPVWLYVDESVTIRGDISGDSTDLLIAQVSSSEVHVENHFGGTMVAPNAKISVASEKFFSGALLADEVEMHQGAVLFFRPFLHTWEQEEF